MYLNLHNFKYDMIDSVVNLVMNMIGFRGELICVAVTVSFQLESVRFESQIGTLAILTDLWLFLFVCL
jgi:hypothetical protein